MKITINNYEVFAVDYLDGKLDAVQKAQFILFLEEHPSIKEELNLVFNMVLDQPNVVYEEKAALKKTEFVRENDRLLIGKIEGDLNVEEMELLRKRLLQESTLSDDLRAYEKTILQPDLSITYDNKRQLKRGGSYRIYWQYAAAAILLIAFALPFVIDNPNKSSQTALLMDTEKPKPAIIIPEKVRSVSDAVSKSNASAQTQTRKLRKDIAVSNTIKTQKVEKISVLSANVAEQPVIRSKPKTNELIALSCEMGMSVSSDELSSTITENYDNAEFLTPSEYIVSNLNRSVSTVVIDENKPKATANKKLNVAGLALKAIAELSGKNIQLKKKYNDNGQVYSIALLSDNFEYSRTK